MAMIAFLRGKRVKASPAVQATQEHMTEFYADIDRRDRTTGWRGTYAAKHVAK